MRSIKFMFKYTVIFVKFLMKKYKTSNENSTYNSMKFYFKSKNYGVRTNNELTPKHGLGWPLFLFLLTMDLCMFALIAGYYIMFYPIHYAKSDLWIFLWKVLKLLWEVLMVYYQQSHIFIMIYIVSKHIALTLVKFFFWFNLSFSKTMGEFLWSIYDSKMPLIYDLIEDKYAKNYQLQQDSKWKYLSYFIFR